MEENTQHLPGKTEQPLVIHGIAEATAAAAAASTAAATVCCAGSPQPCCNSVAFSSLELCLNGSYDSGECLWQPGLQHLPLKQHCQLPALLG
jgi:hypothetical protein